MDIFAPDQHTQGPQAKDLRQRAGIWEDLPDLLSLVLFLGATVFIFRSWEFGLFVTASLGFHELGHAAMLRKYGLPYRIGFSWAGAWTWSPLEERRRLSQRQNVMIHISGPLFSLLLSLGALFLWQFLPGTGLRLGVLANFSAQVALLNLLPLGNLTDGGKIMRRLVGSLDGDGRFVAVILPMAFTALLLVVYNLLALPRVEGAAAASYALSVILIGVWVGLNLVIESRRRPFAGEDPQQPVSANQAFAFIAAIWGLLILGITIATVTPFWLAPEYVLGIYRNVIGLAHLLH
jgi:hypothetical protein